MWWTYYSGGHTIIADTPLRGTHRSDGDTAQTETPLRQTQSCYGTAFNYSAHIEINTHQISWQEIALFKGKLYLSCLVTESGNPIESRTRPIYFESLRCQDRPNWCQIASDRLPTLYRGQRWSHEKSKGWNRIKFGVKRGNSAQIMTVKATWNEMYF